MVAAIAAVVVVINELMVEAVADEDAKGSVVLVVVMLLLFCGVEAVAVAETLALTLVLLLPVKVFRGEAVSVKLKEFVIKLMESLLSNDLAAAVFAGVRDEVVVVNCVDVAV